MIASSYGKRQQSVVLDSHSQRIFRLRKGVMTSARLISDRLRADASTTWVPLMVTLTYAPAFEWKPDHISVFISTIQKYADRKGQRLPYVWVMELQKSGVPHYHVILWVPRRWHLPRSDARGWWPHGSTHTCRVRHAVGYVAKYASKGASVAGSRFPKGARLHGIGGITKTEARIIAWWKLPAGLRRGAEGSEVWRRASGGGWVCRDGESVGEYIPSAWGLSAIDVENKRVRLVEKRPGAGSDLGERIAWGAVGVDAWREAIYDQGRALLAANDRAYRADRPAWVSQVEPTPGQSVFVDFRQAAVVAESARPMPGRLFVCPSCVSRLYGGR